MISLSLRRQTISRMCDALQERLRLPERPTAISGPPSHEPESPASAVLIDSTKVMIYDDDEIQADEDNQPLFGSTAVLTSEPNLDIGNGAYLSIIGKMICKGRIWVGARLAPKREELESKIYRLFFEDTDAPGRWMIDIPNPVVGDYTLPCPWSVAAFISDSTWTGEYAFNERLWAWITFELEVELLVPRNIPLVRQFLLGFDVHVDQPVVDGAIADLDGGADNEYYTGYPPVKTVQNP